MATDLTQFIGPLGQTIPMVLGIVLLLVAALHDVAARTIPNWTSIGIALLGVFLRFAGGQLLLGLALGLLVFVLATFCWLRGWMGGGDVKLMAAAAIFVPPVHVGAMLVDITLAGGIVATIYLVSRTVLRRLAKTNPPRPQGLLGRVLRAERWRLMRGGPLPYASAIAAGTVFVIISG